MMRAEGFVILRRKPIPVSRIARVGVRGGVVVGGRWTGGGRDGRLLEVEEIILLEPALGQQTMSKGLVFPERRRRREGE